MTKNLLKLMLKTCPILTIALVALLGFSAPSRAINLSESQLAINLQDYDARTISLSTSTAGLAQAAINLRYVGSSTEATVSIDGSGAGITFYAPNNVLDTSIGVAGVLSTTTYPTVGALCDAIDATANYICTLRDARRSDNSALLLGQTAASGLRNLNNVSGFDIAFSTGRLAATAAPYFYSIGITPAPGKRVILKKCDMNAASGTSAATALPIFTVSGVKRKSENTPISESSVMGPLYDDTRVIWNQTMTSSATALTVDFTDGRADGGITFAQGVTPVQQTINQASPNIGRVVVRVETDVATVQEGASNFLRCFWVER